LVTTIYVVQNYKIV